MPLQGLYLNVVSSFCTQLDGPNVQSQTLNTYALNTLIRCWSGVSPDITRLGSLIGPEDSLALSPKGTLRSIRPKTLPGPQGK